MKKFIIVCLCGVIGWNGSLLVAFAQVPTPTPSLEIPIILRDPIERILKLEISDGLKRFLLADLYAANGEYPKALEMLDYTNPTPILNRSLAIEKAPEVKRLLEYQQQKIAYMQQSQPEEIIRREKLRRVAEAKYATASAYKDLRKFDKAIQELSEALDVYQEIRHVEGQLLVHYELAQLYKEMEKSEEALQHAREFMALFPQLPLAERYEEIQKILEE